MRSRLYFFAIDFCKNKNSMGTTICEAKAGSKLFDKACGRDFYFTVLLGGILK